MSIITGLAKTVTGPEFVDTTIPPRTPEHPPPGGVPPVSPHGRPPWSRNAKAILAVLVVATVLGTLGTIIGMNSGDDGAAEQELRARIETLTAERVDLVGQVAALQANIDDVEAARDVLVARLAALDGSNDDLTAEREGLLDRVDALDGQIASLGTERDGLVDRVAELETEVQVQSQRANAALAERDALAGRFPVEFDAALGTGDVVGTYLVDSTMVYCDGLGACGTVPVVKELTIRATSNGHLVVQMKNGPTAGVSTVDGVVYAVFDSTDVVPACNGAPRVARVALAIFGQGVSVAKDGTGRIVGLGSSMTVTAAATAACPAGMAIYSGQLTPKA